MTNTRVGLNLVAVAALTSFAISAAHGQSRTWVSGVGNDANPCSRTAPCKTFAGAISKTAIGGEINVLDPGGFGALTINKAITVDGLGIIGGNLSSGISGFTINITTNLATDRVIIRNIEINGNSAVGGFHGIRFLDGAELTVENVTIMNFTGNGINIAQTQTSVTNIRNVTTDNITGAGVRVTTTAGKAFAVIENCRLRGTAEGVHAINDGFVTVNDTVIAKATAGIRTSGTNSFIHVDDAMVAFCGTGIQASPGSRINVSDSMIVQNNLGVDPNGGTALSAQGNSLLDNVAPGGFNAANIKQ
jgi:hypothetical protein